MEEQHFTGFIFPFLASLFTALWLAPLIILIKYFYLGGDLDGLNSWKIVSQLGQNALLGIVTLAFALLPLAVMIGRWHPEFEYETGGVRTAGFIISGANTGLLLMTLSGKGFSGSGEHITVWCTLFTVLGGHSPFVEWLCAIIGAVLGIVALVLRRD